MLLPGAGRMLKPYDEKVCRVPGDKLYGSDVEQLGVSSSPKLRSQSIRATSDVMTYISVVGKYVPTVM